MAEKPPERSAGPTDVQVISITVSVPPAAPRHRLLERVAEVRVPRWAVLVIAAGAAFAAVGAIVATGPPSGPARRPAGVDRAVPGVIQRAAAAASLAYRYPPSCMGMAISNTNPHYVAEVERANGCAGFSGSVTASFHRTNGRWRLVLSEGNLLSPVDSAYRPLGCLTLATVIRDPSFIGPDRAICLHGRLAWLH